MRFDLKRIFYVFTSEYPLQSFGSFHRRMTEQTKHRFEA